MDLKEICLIIICISTVIFIITSHNLLRHDRHIVEVVRNKRIRNISKLHATVQCPSSPPRLLGLQTNDTFDPENRNPPKLHEIANANPKLSEGGRFSPETCTARYRVAIIIPLRGRDPQLRGLLSHMHPIWQRQQIEYSVYTVTQAGMGLFNKGKLMNAGFLEASKDREYDCYVFHDVDLLLENDECLYWCTEEVAKNKKQVVHMVTFMDKFQYKLLRYDMPCLPQRYRSDTITYFGGITMFTRDQFLDVNGFSNIYWGWGGEDDDMALRVRRKGYVIKRDPKCHYRMLKHESAGSNGTNNIAYRIASSAFKRQDRDGLNTLKYKVLSRMSTPLFTNLTIDVGSPSEKMMRLFNDPKEKEDCDGAIFLQSDVW